jgi:hypothetical protein
MNKIKKVKVKDSLGRKVPIMYTTLIDGVYYDIRKNNPPLVVSYNKIVTKKVNIKFKEFETLVKKLVF